MAIQPCAEIDVTIHPPFQWRIRSGRGQTSPASGNRYSNEVAVEHLIEPALGRPRIGSCRAYAVPGDNAPVKVANVTAEPQGQRLCRAWPYTDED